MKKAGSVFWILALATSLSAQNSPQPSMDAMKKLDFLIPLQEKTVQWSIPTPGQNIRFTMNLNEKDQWLETGEFSPDGNKWMKFFEMKLQRVK